MRLLIWLFTALAVEACSTTPFSITVENIEAAKPRTVILTSLKTTDTGVHIILLSFSNVDVASFLRQLEGAGAVNVQLLEIKPVMACGRRIMRAEFKIDGDTSRFVSPPPTDGKTIYLDAPNGKKFQCAVP